MGLDRGVHQILVSGDPLPDGSLPRWSPLAHTLVYGPTEAVVVDPPITVAQGDALADWIAGLGVRLTAVYLTHWHADHWLSTVRLLARFPAAQVYASVRTAERMRAGEVPGALWTALFPGQLPDSPLGFPIHSGAFTVDSEPIVPVEVGHSDTDDTTVLHVPSLGLLAAGDVVYNNVRLYLAETPGGGAQGWHAALDRVAALRPARPLHLAGPCRTLPAETVALPAQAPPSETLTVRSVALPREVGWKFHPSSARFSPP